MALMLRLDSYANSLLTNLINRAIVRREQSSQSTSASRLSFATNRGVFTTIEIGGMGTPDPQSTSSGASGSSGLYGLQRVDKAHIVGDDLGSW